MPTLELSTDLIGSPATEDLDALVSSARRAEIYELASRFPVPVRAVGYECRLASADDDVDYNLAFFPTARLAHVLGELRASRRSPPWQGILQLLEPWCLGRSELTPLVPFVCAAFDHAVDDGGLTVPSLSFCVDPEFYIRRLGTVLPPLPFGQLERIAEVCSRVLCDADLSEHSRRSLRRFACDGEQVEVRHLSVMLSRAVPAFKLDVRLPKRNLGRFLQRCGWGNRALQVEAEVLELLRHQSHLQLNLPLDLTPSSALELEFLNDRMDASATDRFRILRDLGDRGIVASDKARSLEQVWQRPLIVNSEGQAIARSWYLKLRLHPDGARDAKAYVGLLARGAARQLQALSNIGRTQE